MATVTLTITRCAAGGHVHVLIKETGHKFSLNSQDIQDRNYEGLKSLDIAEADLVLQMIRVVRDVTAPKTAAKIKTAIEAATFDYMERA